MGYNEKNYVGGNKLKIEVDVDNFSFTEFEKDIKEVMGYRTVEKIHFRMPGRPLACGLRLLYEMLVDDMLKIVTENGSIEIYTEHKIIRDCI